MSREIRIHARNEIAHRPVSRYLQEGAPDPGSADDDTALLPHANRENPRVVPSIRMDTQRDEHPLHHGLGRIDRRAPNLRYAGIG